MADAIALIVAGSGEISDKEVYDLLTDYYGDSDVSIVVPVTRDDFTPAVESAVSWWLDDDTADKADILTIQVEGSNLSRKTSSYGSGDTEKVQSFGEIFKDNFDGFDKIDFFIALPEPDAEDLDLHVEWLEAAEAAKRDINIRNLCRGLDDIVLTEPDEPEVAAEPDPEPEKPVRRSRRSTAQAVDIPNNDAPESATDPEPPAKPARKSRASRGSTKAAESEPERPAGPTGLGVAFNDAISTVQAAQEYFRLVDQSLAVYTGEAFVPRNLTVRLAAALETLLVFGKRNSPSEPAEAPQGAEDEAETPKRGRGRPRTNFEERQVWDEENEEWVKSPRGRTPKGTKWRVCNTETDEVLDEGIA